MLDRQSSERDKDEVSYFYVGDHAVVVRKFSAALVDSKQTDDAGLLGMFFVYSLALSSKYADFQEKSSWRFLGKSSKLLVLHKNLNEDFFLKIGILSAKNVPNIEV